MRTVCTRIYYVQGLYIMNFSRPRIFSNVENIAITTVDEEIRLYLVLTYNCRLIN